jgi:hypothetical protein
VIKGSDSRSLLWMRWTAEVAWFAVCGLYLASFYPSRCAKLPSWRGPDTFFDGTLPSKRSLHGFESFGDGRIYIFGGISRSKICVWVLAMSRYAAEQS